jgi:hypothetical protein
MALFRDAAAQGNPAAQHALKVLEPIGDARASGGACMAA